MKYLLFLLALTACKQEPLKSQPAGEYNLEEICIEHVTYLKGPGRITVKLDRRGRPVGCDVAPILQEVTPSGMEVK